MGSQDDFTLTPPIDAQPLTSEIASCRPSSSASSSGLSIPAATPLRPPPKSLAKPAMGRPAVVTQPPVEVQSLSVGRSTVVRQPPARRRLIVPAASLRSDTMQVAVPTLPTDAHPLVIKWIEGVQRCIRACMAEPLVSSTVLIHEFQLLQQAFHQNTNLLNTLQTFYRDRTSLMYRMMHVLVRLLTHRQDKLRQSRRSNLPAHVTTAAHESVPMASLAPPSSSDISVPSSSDTSESDISDASVSAPDTSLPSAAASPSPTPNLMEEAQHFRTAMLSFQTLYTSLASRSQASSTTTSVATRHGSSMTTDTARAELSGMTPSDLIRRGLSLTPAQINLCRQLWASPSLPPGSPPLPERVSIDH